MSLTAPSNDHWAADFDVPVIIKVGGGDKRLHAPDFEADSPAPLCSGAKATTEWQVVELESIHGWYPICGYPACKHNLGGRVTYPY